MAASQLISFDLASPTSKLWRMTHGLGGDIETPPEEQAHISAVRAPTHVTARLRKLDIRQGGWREILRRDREAF